MAVVVMKTKGMMMIDDGVRPVLSLAGGYIPCLRVWNIRRIGLASVLRNPKRCLEMTLRINVRQNHIFMSHRS